MSNPTTCPPDLELSKFSTCEISDALLKLGVPSGGFIPDLNAYSAPAVLGRAYTILHVPCSSSAPIPSRHPVDEAPEGSVIVVLAPPESKNAVWGGLMTLGAMAKGARGVVVLGRVRDLDEHRAERFPVYAYSTSTLPQSPFTRPSATQIPLTIPAPHLSEPATLTIQPGDIVMGDENGVVFFHSDLVSDVLREAEERRRIDRLCEADLRLRKGIKETFKKWRT